MWIKTITRRGQVKEGPSSYVSLVPLHVISFACIQMFPLLKVRSVNWKDVFSRMRDTAGFPAPGYLTHEAVQYSEKQGMWYFLPRKASTTAYEETADETKWVSQNAELR